MNKNVWETLVASKA